MSVVNVHVSCIRPTYKNLAEWAAVPGHVYIGRSTFVEGRRYPGSVFQNPFKIGHDGTREDVIAKFETYIRARLSAEPALRDKLVALRGKVLGCWCHPEGCHGDVLLRLIGEYT